MSNHIAGSMHILAVTKTMNNPSSSSTFNYLIPGLSEGLYQRTTLIDYGGIQRVAMCL